MSTIYNNEAFRLTLSTDMNSKVEIHNVSQSSSVKPRARTMLNQPKGTASYIVGDNDTLEKIALRYNLTPSELLQLNKLNTRLVFPGQVLFVPKQCSSDNSDQQQQQEITTSNIAVPTPSISTISKPKDGDALFLLSDRRFSAASVPSSSPPLYQQTQQDVGPVVWSMTRQTAARPGRAHRLSSDPTMNKTSAPKSIEERLKTQKEDNKKQIKLLQRTLSKDENHQLDAECLQRFMKLNVRLVTEERKNVAGTLIITPNAIMFDPDVRDPLVKEHGIDKYGIIIQMELLAGIAVYEDLTMYEHEATSRDEEKRRSCHSTSVKHSLENPLLNTDEEQIRLSMSYLLDKIDKETNFSTISNTNDCCMLFNASSTIQRHLSRHSSDNLLQPIENYKHSTGILLDNDDKNVNNNFNQILSHECQFENCVPIDQYNKRFGEIDELLHKQQENYLEPHPITIPYYLCVKTSMHIHDIPSLNPKQYKKLQDKHNDNIYGKKQLEYEYWFSISEEKIDHIYSFFLRWSTERESDQLIDVKNDSETNDKPTSKGFVLIANDDLSLNDIDLFKKNCKTSDEKQIKPHYLQRQNTLLKDWEIISVDEIYRRINSTQTNSARSYDEGFPPPKLLQPSTLINELQSKQILLELPARLHALTWYMTFSTEAHGFSLNQLYRRSLEFDRDMPSLIIIKDVEQNMFGAYLSRQLIVSESFYGTGESFLYTFRPEFRVFNWSGSNEFFVKGDLNALGFGSGDGTYGLWIDGDLYRGRTCPSKTFNNDILSSNEDFIIASMEVWTFTS